MTPETECLREESQRPPPPPPPSVNEETQGLIARLCLRAKHYVYANATIIVAGLILICAAFAGGIYVGNSVWPQKAEASTATPPTVAEPTQIPTTAPVEVTRVVTAEVTRAVTAEVTRVVIATLEPTAIPPTPTPTLIPSPTPTPNLAQSLPTVLHPGDTKRANGVEVAVDNLVLDEVGHGRCVTALSFTLQIANNTGDRIYPRTNTASWFAIDGKGRTYPLVQAVDSLFGLNSCTSWDLTSLAPGTTRQTLWLEGRRSQLTESTWLQIVIPELSSVRDAIWGIEIRH